MAFSEQQLKILAFPFTEYDALICDGAIRSGKTSIMSVSFFDWAMNNFNDCNFAVCGKTVGSAIKNIITPYISMYYAKQKYGIKFTRSSTNLLILTKGSTVNRFYIYGGKDESSYMLIQGITLAGVFLDEVALMTRSFVEQALARCSVDGSKFWFNCNPESPQHWFYKEWILKAKERNALHLHFKLEDNPSLTPKIIKRYKSMYTGNFYRRYIEGEWVKADGLVYSIFDYSRNCIDFKEQIVGVSEEDLYKFRKTKGYAEYYVSIDYGIVNPFACYLWCILDGKAYCIKELYYDPAEHDDKRLTDLELYIKMKEFIGKTVIEYIVVDPSASSFIEMIYREGDYGVVKANNEVLQGISLVSTCFNNGTLFIDKSCEHMIEELGLYSWDVESASDRVIKENDHACDSMRYFVNTVYKKEMSWALDEAAEHITQLKQHNQNGVIEKDTYDDIEDDDDYAYLGG